MSTEIKGSNEVVNCRWHSTYFQQRAGVVSEAGRRIFAHTALTNGRSVDANAVETIGRFMTEVKPDPGRYPALANWIGERSLTEHSQLSGKIAYKLTGEINKALGMNLNPYAHQAALQLHDLGRTVIQSFMETDELTDILWEKIGLRNDLKKLTHNAHLYWDDGEVIFDELAIATRISIMADVFGKRSRKDPKRIRHTNEILQEVSESKKMYMEKPNQTRYEKELVAGKLKTYSQKENYVLSSCMNWVSGLGINLDQLLNEVMNEYTSENEK